jgi:hypothetical protein
MALRTTDTIPKLDQINYLFDALGLVRDQFTFDGIRKELIRMRPENDRTRNRVSQNTFWSNARDVLRELMRLGLVNRTALPSRPVQLDAHRARKFTLSSEGEQFLTLEGHDVWEFRYRFAQAMLIAHPYLRELHQLLRSREFFFPRIQRSELPGEADSWKEKPPEPMTIVSSRVAESLREVLNLNVRASDLESSMCLYLNAAWRRIPRDQKSHLFAKAVVKAVNDVIVRVLLQIFGMRMDYVTFRSAVGLLSDLNVIWHTRSLEGRRGWTVWETSLAPVPLLSSTKSAAAQSLCGSVWFKPRVQTEELIKDKMIEAFFSLQRGGFALIHVLRAEVCHGVRIHGRDFDTVLRNLHAKKLEDPRYVVNLDRGGGDELPPSEEPFRIGDRPFYLITLLKREREE